MRYLMLSWTGLALLCFSFPAMAADVSTLVSQAKEQLNTQAYDAAEMTLNRALSMKKKHLEARFLLARISELRGDYRKAIKRYKYLLLLNSKHVGALAGLAHAEEKLGHHEKAKSAFIRAFKMEPDQWKWLFEVVRIDMDNRRYRRGVEKRLKKLIKAKYREQESLQYLIKLYHAEGIKYKAKKYEKILERAGGEIAPSNIAQNSIQPVRMKSMQPRPKGEAKSQNAAELERQFSRLHQRCVELISKNKLSEAEHVLARITDLISRNPDSEATLNGIDPLIGDARIWQGRDNLQMRFLIQWSNVSGSSRMLKAYLIAKRSTLVYRVGFAEEGMMLFNKASDLDAYALWKKEIHLYMDQPQSFAYLKEGMPLALVGEMLRKGADQLNSDNPDKLRILVDYARFASVAGHPALAMQALRHIRQHFPELDQQQRARVSMVEALAQAAQGRIDVAYKTLITFGLIPQSVSKWVTGNEARLFAPLYRDRRKLSFVLGIESSALPKSVQAYPSSQAYPDLYGNMKIPPAAPKIGLPSTRSPAATTAAPPFTPRHVTPAPSSSGDGDMLILE